MKRVIVVHLLLLTIAACSSTAQPTPAVIHTQMATVGPAPSALPPTRSSENGLNSEWNGIPIMPGAITGEGDEEGYVFTTQATLQEVQEYYQSELEKLGWHLQPSAEEGSDSSMMLSFMDSTSAILTVNIISNGEKTLVILVK